MLSSIIPTIFSCAVTAVLAWFFTRNKLLAETEKLKLENLDKIISIYEGAADKLMVEVKELRKEVEQLRAENSTLKIEIKKLEKTLSDFQPA